MTPPSPSSTSTRRRPSEHPTAPSARRRIGRRERPFVHPAARRPAHGGEAAREELARSGRGVDVQVVEPRDLAVDIAKNFASGFPSPDLADAIESVTSADGLIAVTPVFTASYSGLFKSFFDVIDNDALTGKPVLISRAVPRGRTVILTVDDDPGVSRAVERDLRRRYGDTYRIVRAESGASALETLRELKLRGDRVAVILSDFRMPTVSVLLIDPPDVSRRGFAMAPRCAAAPAGPVAGAGAAV